MADEVRLYGPDGRPVRKRDLTREAGRPTLTGVRQTWRHESVASGLTPRRLAAILRTADDGDGRQRDYLTLAEEIEERDPHYAAVLGVRKRAVSGLEPSVEAATDDAGDIELADAVRGLIQEPAFGELLDDCLDALGKGFSAVEIIWERGAEWWPARYEWRDPRFFTFDREDGRTLRLLDEADSFRGLDLAPYKWIVHVPRLKSGLPMRGGLARLVAISYMVKAYTVTDWTAFAEVFGMPLRLGRYGPNATEADIHKLITAVANLGTDAAAVLPDSMRVEFHRARQPDRRRGPVRETGVVSRQAGVESRAGADDDDRRRQLAEPGPGARRGARGHPALRRAAACRHAQPRPGAAVHRPQPWSSGAGRVSAAAAAGPGARRHQDAGGGAGETRSAGAAGRGVGDPRQAGAAGPRGRRRSACRARPSTRTRSPYSMSRR